MKRPLSPKRKASITAWRRRNPDKVAEYSRRSSERHRAKYNKAMRSAHFLKKYGLTLAQHAAMMEAQSGCCAICRVATPHLYVDHCHASGTIRGGLCKRCNWGLGQFRDSPKLLRLAARYLLALPLSK